MTTYKIDIKKIIAGLYEGENATLTINYTTETGRGNITINNMCEIFPVAAGKLKTVIDIIKKAENPTEPATVLYNFLKTCADHLNNIYNKIDPVNDEEKRDRAEIANAIKKYNANINTLCKYFNFECSQAAEPVKMLKTNVVVKLWDSAKNAPKVENRTGKRFIKNGVVFHAYKTKKTVNIIIPCCGLSCVTYDGAINAAPEYITPELLNTIKNFDFEKVNNELLTLLENAENIVLNNDLVLPEPAEKEPEPATTPDADENTTPEPEPAPELTAATDPDINNAINIINNDIKYTIIAGPHNNYDIIAQTQNDYNFKMYSILIDAAGVVKRYAITTNNNSRSYCNNRYFNNENVKQLIDLYNKLKELHLLPEYTPLTAPGEAPRAENLNAKKPAPPVYIALVYYGLCNAARAARIAAYNTAVIYNYTRPKTAQKHAKSTKPYYYTTNYKNTEKRPGKTAPAVVYTLHAVRGIFHRSNAANRMLYNTC